MRDREGKLLGWKGVVGWRVIRGWVVWEGGGKRFKVGRVELHFPPSPPQRRIAQGSCSRSLKINTTEVGKFCSFREVDSLQDERKKC